MVDYFKMLCSYFFMALSDIFIFVVCIVGVQDFLCLIYADSVVYL